MPLRLRLVLEVFAIFACGMATMALLTF